jgi:PAS domain S-box-containing protein
LAILVDGKVKLSLVWKDNVKDKDRAKTRRASGPSDIRRDISELDKSGAGKRQPFNLYEHFFTLSNELFCIIESNGHLKLLNQAFKKMLGFTKKELISRPFCEFIHPEDRGTAYTAVRNFASGVTLDNLENRIICKDGSYRWLSWKFYTAEAEVLMYAVDRDITKRKKAEDELINNRECLAELLKDKTSELTSVIELLRAEIDDRKHTEQKLKDSEQRYRGLFNYMSSGVAVYEAVENGEDFIFRDFNHAGEEIDKIKKEDIIGKKITTVFPGVKEFGLFEVFQRVWRTGEPEHYPISMYKDKRISGWRENYIYKLPSGEIVAVYNDVTDRRQASEMLQKRTHELGERVKELSCLYNLSKLVVKRGVSIEDILQGTVDLLPPAFEYPEVACARIIFEGQIFKTNNFKKTPWKQTSNITVNEKNLGFLEVCYLEEMPERDNGPFLREGQNLINAITEELGRTVERKWAKLQAIRSGQLALLGELAAGVAHEINNPINGIINYAQILININKKKRRENDIAGRILKESDRIAEIVKSLLSFARDNKEKKHHVRIHEIISVTLALIATQIRNDCIRLNLNIPSDFPEIIAHPEQIKQVFLNIISNARYSLNQKYPGKHGDKTLEIVGEEINVENLPHIQITFNDRGMGIPVEVLDKVINPFFSTKSGDEGTGLGLSISHGIVSDHGGKLMISSVEGEFTKVTVELPFGK